MKEIPALDNDQDPNRLLDTSLEAIASRWQGIVADVLGTSLSY
jgi:hypothetical protein